MSTTDPVWLAMKRQVSLERLQQLGVAAFNGTDPGALTEAERYFFERLQDEAARYPGVTLDLLDL